MEESENVLVFGVPVLKYLKYTAKFKYIQPYMLFNINKSSVTCYQVMCHLVYLNNPIKCCHPLTMFSKNILVIRNPI